MQMPFPANSTIHRCPDLNVSSARGPAHLGVLHAVLLRVGQHLLHPVRVVALRSQAHDT